jgi:ABC-type uncharacterized transport system fused permease/ATPase subunit
MAPIPCVAQKSSDIGKLTSQFTKIEDWKAQPNRLSETFTWDL